MRDEISMVYCNNGYVCHLIAINIICQVMPWFEWKVGG